jgi:hypothetical protein
MGQILLNRNHTVPKVAPRGLTTAAVAKEKMSTQGVMVCAAVGGGPGAAGADAFAGSA